MAVEIWGYEDARCVHTTVQDHVYMAAGVSLHSVTAVSVRLLVAQYRWMGARQYVQGFVEEGQIQIKQQIKRTRKCVIILSKRLQIQQPNWDCFVQAAAFQFIINFSTNPFVHKVYHLKCNPWTLTYCGIKMNQWQLNTPCNRIFILPVTVESRSLCLLGRYSHPTEQMLCSSEHDVVTRRTNVHSVPLLCT
jgi:hypothetical protein